MSHLSRDDLKRIFEKLDENHDGLVSLDELNRLLEGVAAGQRLSPAELESLAGKPALDFDDFLSFYDSTIISNHDEEDEDPTIAKAFEVFDLNRDGFISCDELQSVLARLGLGGGCGDDCKSMIRAFDANSDGKLDFEEFKDMMLLTTSSS